MQDKEAKKTLIYVLVAGMALLVAWEPWRPSIATDSSPAVTNTSLLPDFKDPLAAKSLEIVKFDEDTATVRDFRVGQTGGVWSIPSHSDYPADAKEHMANAATALLDLKILGVASDRPGDAAEFGVVAPEPTNLKVGAQGVGTRVTLKDGKDKTLADVIIGKEVKDQPMQRYVRQMGRDQIYVVAVKTDKFSTKFEDWIEKDLLKLNAADVRDVSLNDYSLREGVANGRLSVGIQNRNKIKLAFDDTKSAWRLVELANFDEEGKPEPAGLADDEELNNEKLNAMKAALDDLQIVDVQRKPKGLSQDLKASEEFVNDNESAMSLIRRGFYPVGQNKEIFSSEGEVTCATKDGVRYVLRFGQPAISEAGEDKQPEDKEKSGANRYLFLMAQFDESQIPKPKFESVPGEEKATEAKPGEEKPAAETPATEKPAADTPAPDAPAEPAAEKPSAEPAAEPKPAETPAPPAAKKPATKAAPGKAVPQKKTADEEEEEKAPAEEQPKDEAAEQPADEKPVTEKPADKPAEEKPAAKPSTPEDEAKIAIQKENKRRQEEYDATVKKGQDKVKELNDRFADWYFIISDDVYKKIHLGRADIVKKKEADKKEGAGALNDLQKGIGGGKLPPLPPQ